MEDLRFHSEPTFLFICTVANHLTSQHQCLRLTTKPISYVITRVYHLTATYRSLVNVVVIRVTATLAAHTHKGCHFIQIDLGIKLRRASSPIFWG